MSNNQSFIRERKRERDSFSRLLLLESESARGRRCARRTFSKCPRRAGTLPPLWKTHTAVTFPSDLIRKSDQGCRASPWHEPTRWRLSVEIRWTTAKFGRNHQSTGGKRKRKDSATPKSLFFFSFVSWRPKKFKSRATALKNKTKKKTSFSKSIRVETATPRRGWDFVIESIGLTYLSIGCVIIYIYIYWRIGCCYRALRAWVVALWS